MKSRSANSARCMPSMNARSTRRPPSGLSGFVAAEVLVAGLAQQLDVVAELDLEVERRGRRRAPGSRRARGCRRGAGRSRGTPRARRRRAGRLRKSRYSTAATISSLESLRVSWKDTGQRRAAHTRATSCAAPRPKAAKPRPRSRKVRPGDRLLEQPGFVMCTLRSGSTLLRVLLDSHSQIHCPHEIHLRYLGVDLETKWVERSMKEMGLDEERLEYLLWDRVLHRELTGSGKPRLVDQDAQRRLHRRPDQDRVAGREADLPAAPPRRDRAAPARTTRATTPTTTRTST